MKLTDRAKVDALVDRYKAMARTLAALRFEREHKVKSLRLHFDRHAPPGFGDVPDQRQPGQITVEVGNVLILIAADELEHALMDAWKAEGDKLRALGIEIDIDPHGEELDRLHKQMARAEATAKPGDRVVVQ